MSRHPNRVPGFETQLRDSDESDIRVVAALANTLKREVRSCAKLAKDATGLTGHDSLAKTTHVANSAADLRVSPPQLAKAS